MKKQVFFLHSAGPQDHHRGSSGLIEYVKDKLCNDYHLIYPKMPNTEEPEYMLWKAQLEKEFVALDGEVLLIGHSLGGAVLLKYLSEKTVNVSITGLFLIAAPYWGKDDNWQSDEYTLPDNVASRLPQMPQMCFYHSRNDEIVPSSHLEHYKQKLPQANTTILDGKDHFFSNGLPMLVDDISKL
ncbi:alpha/beta hydrolase [Radiobacillus kanasensis]|uniref:alpha/beta hydrolase n=1 Tax=Radiobacillus kanasensis TaxID=2844358 RepID=UPI001E3ED9DC|nr:alpha/beta hydrolase [Radiobacillus kanasensis]UFT99530.1 alpha/beta hydrolase [Radiobacillus kanasensis]